MVSSNKSQTYGIQNLGNDMHLLRENGIEFSDLLRIEPRNKE